MFKGGFNIAMKVPAHEYEAVMAFYRDIIRLEPSEEKPPFTGFKLGPNRLWIDRDARLSQAEVWLELFTDDASAAAGQLQRAGVVRCDEVEPLDEGFEGFWVMNPANIVHMVRRPEAW